MNQYHHKYLQPIRDSIALTVDEVFDQFVTDYEVLNPTELSAAEVMIQKSPDAQKLMHKILTNRIQGIDSKQRIVSEYRFRAQLAILLFPESFKIYLMKQGAKERAGVYATPRYQAWESKVDSGEIFARSKRLRNSHPIKRVFGDEVIEV